MRQDGRSRRVRNIILIALLALLCIGGTELAVCSVEDPALFAKIAAPAVGLYQDTAASLRSLGDALRARADARAEARAAAKLERERLLAAAAESQAATAPAIRTEYIPADPAITELVAEDGREYLLGGNLRLVYYNQADEEWAEQPFGVDPIGSCGCGPTSLAMAVSSMTETDIDPAEMALWAASMGYAAPHSGSYLSIVEGTAASYGLDCAPMEALDAETILRALNAGGVIVALMGPGHFTNGGHFILLHGVTLGGEVLVADPNSRENSLMTWDAQLIVDELSESRWNGAPLWLLTAESQL